MLLIIEKDLFIYQFCEISKLNNNFCKHFMENMGVVELLQGEPIIYFWGFLQNEV